MPAAAIREHLREHYGLVPDRVRRLSATDTEVWRVDAGARSFVLRRHGPHAPEEVRSSMEWLEALGGTGVGAPEPMRTRRGALVAGHLTLVRWVEGRRRLRDPRPVHFERLGRAMARLHEHAAAWRPPRGFTRPVWDAATVFCESGHARPRGGDPWALVPGRYRAILRRAAERARPALDGGDRRLVHADLHLHNVLFHRGRARPVDFDDAGFGPPGYDLAGALAPHRLDRAWPGILGAFLRGYATRRPPPDLAGLDDFILGRLAGLSLWACSTAETVPSLRGAVPRLLARGDEDLRRLLRGAGRPPVAVPARAR